MLGTSPWLPWKPGHVIVVTVTGETDAADLLKRGGEGYDRVEDRMGEFVERLNIHTQLYIDCSRGIFSEK